MPEVYYYIPKENAENAVDCGIKLSEWADREVKINNIEKKCIRTLLSPTDEIGLFGSDEYKCLKLKVPYKHCFIAEGILYGPGENNDEIKSLYEKSIIESDKYKFGDHRRPECLVTCTIIGDDISLLNKAIDLPVLVDEPEKLYLDNLLEKFNEQYDDVEDALFYSFFKMMEEKGSFYEISDEKSRICIFKDKRTNKIYSIKRPDFEKY